MSKSQEFADFSEVFEVSRMVNQAIMKKLGKNPLKSDVVRIKNQSKLNTVISKSFDEIFGNLEKNPWVDQMEKISFFYKEIFNIEINWEVIKLPEWTPERPRLELIMPDITGKQMVEAYKKRFGSSSVYNNDYSKDIDTHTKTSQFRPATPYPFSWTGKVEPDSEHLNKSYDDFCNDGNNYMVPREGIVSALRYRFETGDMLDVKGVTRFHALDAGQFVLNMYGNEDSQFYLVWSSRGSRNPDFGPRQVNF